MSLVLTSLVVILLILDKLRFDFKGGGCGVGFGAGWGFFVLGYGTVVQSIFQLLGCNRRILRRAAEQLDLEREAGLRPPLQTITTEDTGLDLLLDRLIRHIEQRRARQNSAR